MPDSDIVVTEIMYDPENSVHDNNHEWVEITNTGSGSVSLNGWVLDDKNANNTGEGTFENITLSAGDIAIFYNDNITEAAFIAQFNPAPGTVLIPVANWQPLNNSGGDTVQLFNSNGDLVTAVEYEDDASPGQSLNYTPNGTYEGAGVPDPGVVCFTAGSLIETADGVRLIEGLRAGDKVLTRDHGLQSLRWIGRRTVSVRAQVRFAALRPVTIKKHALSGTSPHRDTRVSQQHRIALEGPLPETLFNQPVALCAAIGLKNDHTILVEPPLAPVTYIHLLFDQHEVLFVDGLASESFHPNLAGLGNLEEAARKEVLALFPALAGEGSMPLAYPALTAAEAAVLRHRG